jgi:hypothetical protein
LQVVSDLEPKKHYVDCIQINNKASDSARSYKFLMEVTDIRKDLGHLPVLCCGEVFFALDVGNCERSVRTGSFCE